MRFLCLPGAGMSEEVFENLLEPLIQDLQSDSMATFHFVNGPHVLHQIPKGFQDYLGPPPNRLFFSEKIRDDLLFMSLHPTPLEPPEDIYRNGMKIVSDAKFRESVVASIDFLNTVIDEHGPFEGVIGFSGGSMMASTLLYAHMQKQHQQCQQQPEEKEKRPSFKCAIFFGGFPPFSSDGNKVVLSDEYGEIFRIPTCHILGSDDPLISGCFALYNLCSPDTRIMVETGSNHMIDWDQHNRVEILKAVRKLLSLVTYT